MKTNGKKILVMGGTGSMGSYLVPELLGRGYTVDVVSLDTVASDDPALRYMTANVRDVPELSRVLENKYDGIIDFLHYTEAEFRERYRLFLENTKHYIFLSSYRVFTDLDPVTSERSPRHAEASADEKFRTSGDYSICKAKDEDILRASGLDNWSIVRPSIIFSQLSFPLVSLGACSIVNRALDGRPTIIPDEAREVQGTATWSGDIAKMFAGILLNKSAMCEDYIFATAEHQAWGTVAGYYKELIGLEALTVDLETYKEIYCQHAQWGVWQIDYDRMLNRVMDNSKILRAAGLAQSDLRPLKKALEDELSALPKGYHFPDKMAVNERMDRYLESGGKIIRRL